jgi:hypothetical protein
MTPGEVQGLASLGQLTINPDTGLPEAFSMKSIIPIIANVGLAVATGGMSLPAQMAIMGAANFGMGLLQGQSAGDALLGGVTAAAGTGIMGGLSSLMSGAAAGATGAAAGATGAAGTGAAAGAAGAGATEAALQSSLSTFGTGIGSVNPATGIAPISTQLAASMPSFTPVTDSLLPFNLNSTPSGVIDNVGSAAIPQSAIPSAARIGPTTTAAKFLGTSAAVPQPAMMFDPNLNTSDMQILGGDLASAPQTTPNWFERNIYNPAENIEGTGEGLLESYLSPFRSSLPKDASLLQKYGPLGVVGISGLAATGVFDEEQPEQQQMAKREVDTGFGDYRLESGEERNPETAEEIERRMLAGGVRPSYLGPYRYVRNAAEGGIIGLQQGGMATPQAPSAMSAMLAPPTQQQQPMQQQPMQQQPMPMQGIQPLPDQSIEFKKNMDMEDQLQKQKTASSIQGQSALLGLISGAGNYLQSQGINYPTTTPSGTIPQTPAMNQGTQVNLGASGGFAQGGMPSQSQPYFEGQVQGPGDGQSDEVAFRVDGGQIDGAMLSPDEYVLSADVVSAIGNGSSDAGAAKLDQFMKGVRQDAYGTTKQMQPFNNQGLTNLVA